VGEHPTTAELERLLAGGLAHEDRRVVVRHLWTGCATCRALISAQAALLFPHSPSAAHHQQVSDPCLAAMSAHSAHSAPASRPTALRHLTGLATLPALPALPPPDALAAEEQDEPAAQPELHHAGTVAAPCGARAGRESRKIEQVLAVLEQAGIAGFCELPRHLRGTAGFEALLQRSWSLRHDDPLQMVRLCELATVVATGLNPRLYGCERVRDLQCRAAIELANAYRITSRTEEAQASINEALEHFRMGTQDHMMAARMFVIQGHVSGDRRNFDTALAAFDSAIQIYRRCGEPYQVGDTLIKKGVCCGFACRTEEALKLLGEGLDLIDPQTHPDLTLLAVHNIATILVDCSKYREARALVWRNLPLYNQFAGRVLRLKLRMLEGRIHSGLGDAERAIRDLEEARRGFLEIGQPYMATLVLLDLAALHIRQGRDEDARREALEAADIFLTLSIGREAAVAMMLLKSTFKFRLATTGVLLDEMAQFMRAAEHDPQVSFHRVLS
jgi:tetratricopeptide (TPR) repeat protein